VPNSEGHITWRELLDQTRAVVGEQNVALWLCEEAAGCEGTEFREQLDTLVSERSGLQHSSMLARYRAGEPLQYVLGHWSFRHIDLMVDRRVLIPRPETELIVDIVLNHARNISDPMILDLGTGSGAIGLSVLHELISAAPRVWLTDASVDALDVARSNLAGIGRAGRGAHLALGEWFNAVPEDLRGCFDAIVSNPPYIAEGDAELDESVREWEPLSALISGHDGLHDLRIIVGEAPHWLGSGGLLVVEIGHTQAESVAALFNSAGFINVAAHKDLAGRNRFVSGCRP
jgi:release factor glutamine methyltransferase